MRMPRAPIMFLLALCLLVGSKAAHATSTYITTSFLSPTDSSGFDFQGFGDGDEEDRQIGRVTVVCLTVPLPPAITILGTSATGTVTGLHGTVSQALANVTEGTVVTATLTVQYVHNLGSVLCGARYTTTSQIQAQATAKVTYAKFVGAYIILGNGNVACTVAPHCAPPTKPTCIVPGSQVEVDDQPNSCNVRSPWKCRILAFRSTSGGPWFCSPLNICLPAGITVPGPCT